MACAGRTGVPGYPALQVDLCAGLPELPLNTAFRNRDMAEFSDLRVSDRLTVPAWELSEAFVRASGPGGQNVNKVSNAVHLRFDIRASSLDDALKNSQDLAIREMTKAGYIK
jgi:protein subunit release factor B